MTHAVNSHQNLLKITIPVANFEELQKFQQGIINLLSKIELDDCKPEVKEDIKSLYKLLLLLREAHRRKVKLRV